MTGCTIHRLPSICIDFGSDNLIFILPPGKGEGNRRSWSSKIGQKNTPLLSNPWALFSSWWNYDFMSQSITHCGMVPSFPARYHPSPHGAAIPRIVPPLPAVCRHSQHGTTLPRTVPPLPAQCLYSPHSTSCYSVQFINLRFHVTVNTPSSHGSSCRNICGIIVRVVGLTTYILIQSTI